MIRPVLKDDQLLEDIRRAPADRLHLWWLGQSGFLLTWGGRHVLMDAYLSDSLTEKYAGTDRPHVRMTERPVAPERLDFVDVVTASHLHTDHLDGATIGPLLRANPRVTIIVPEAIRQPAAERLGVPPERLTVIDAGRTVRVADVTIHAVPAAHEQLERDELGRCLFLGYVVQLGPWSVYHAGDTVRYDGMVEQLRRWAIDVALLPINGRLPERRVPGNLWGREAAELASAIGARLAIPCHYEMFEFNTVTPDEFVAAAERLGQPYRVLRCGERWSSDQLPSRSDAVE